VSSAPCIGPLFQGGGCFMFISVSKTVELIQFLFRYFVVRFVAISTEVIWNNRPQDRHMVATEAMVLIKEAGVKDNHRVIC
jgi:hypothetical protein